MKILSSKIEKRDLSKDPTVPALQAMPDYPFRITLMNPLQRSRLKLRGVLLMQAIKKNIDQYGMTIWKLDICTGKPHLSSKVRVHFKDDATIIPYNRRFIFYPDSSFLTYWNIIMMILVIYVLSVSPWVIAFEEQDSSSPFYYTEIAVDLGFILDIIITLNTAYLDRKGNLVASRKKIFINYLKGMLFVDVLSIFPFPIILDNSSFGRSGSMLRVIRVLRIIKIVRASKIPALFDKLDGLESLEPIIKFMKTYRATIRLLMLLFLVLVMAHVTACMWFFTARIYDFNEDTWVSRGGFNYADRNRMYLASLYWAFTVFTTIGFGDIHAFTYLEMTVCVLWMFLGIFFYSFIISTLSSLLSNFDQNSIKLNESLRHATTFGFYAELPLPMIQKIKRTIKNNFSEDSISDSNVQELFANLSSNCRYEVAMSMHGYACQKLKFFYGKSQAFVSDIVPRLCHNVCEPRHVFFHEGDIPHFVYFLISGRAIFVYGTNRVIFKEMPTGSYFGEIEIINHKPRKYTAVARQRCEYFLMAKYILGYILDAYPSVSQQISNLAKKRNKDISNSLMHVKDRRETQLKKERKFNKTISKCESQIYDVKEKLNNLTNIISEICEAAS